MQEQTIIETRQNRKVTLTLNRPEQRNAITQRMMQELLGALGRLEQDAECSVIVLQGQGGYYCTGMDFQEVAGENAAAAGGAVDSAYMSILKAMASSSKVIVSVVDGQALAGGVGLVAASDLVVATPGSTFGLPEALWGLLPACVIPFLIRRLGFQQAYKMALTTQSLKAEEAWQRGLVDDVSETPEEVVRRHLLRVSRLEPATVKLLKSYFRKMWIVDEGMERTAVEEINRLVAAPRVRENIRQYLLHQKFPWET